MTDSAEISEDVHHLVLRNLRLDDYEHIHRITRRVYQDVDGPWSREQYKAQLKRFPEGQICIEDNGRVVAAAMSLIVDYRRWGDRHKYWDITGKGFFTTHDAKGDTLYGADIFVDPDYRGLRLGRRLYDARKALCENLNLRAIVVGGRIPGYHEYQDELTPRQYVEQVQLHELNDTVLTFQLANGFHVRRILRNYLPGDEASSEYAVLLEWININYEEEEENLIDAAKTVVRVGAVQWQMRPMASVDDLLQQVEYFVDAVSGYQSDVILFPEFFNGPLMGQFNQDNPAEAVRHMAEFTEPLRAEMQRLALAYNINIIAGSMPEYEDGVLRNVSYLCRRDGSWERQYKLHITPDESAYWGLQGGNELRVFDTDFGKVGILICYDVEFPELPRILADQGLQILFVPFWTDTKNAYLRVRRCAQARAIENECYVVISGSVGNLPRIENMDMQYSQAAVFTPSDFAFPHDAVAAEATPNTEMTLICDLDLENLKKLRRQGSVRNLRDRRLDLYSVKWK
ncbi:Predicted amidohydrolase [Ectothiorhodosinus mongolicus]|uniref:Predicted amidohydrolase n=1 Tax=Ectothiorhodosinus mongolicus TaxID=233100 RepID=A0A1R3W2A3_9GAMM|nr:bifunctional GNAT family N-acetyltransferase/carbon-nitrogen hydrolase family protein [Ectothiorhodosinus mongolicus]ULX57253.1 hydrolase [Ectothiorhodosinus mongolicus]SIT70646.1 Predicted amidohydrolase [Ectothiorhodosinus mongolicus]